MTKRLSCEQQKFLINTMYSADKDKGIAKGIIDVLFNDVKAYAAEKDNGLPHNSLAAKIRRVHKQIELIESVINH